MTHLEFELLAAALRLAVALVCVLERSKIKLEGSNIKLQRLKIKLQTPLAWCLLCSPSSSISIWRMRCSSFSMIFLPPWSTELESSQRSKIKLHSSHGYKPWALRPRHRPGAPASPWAPPRVPARDQRSKIKLDQTSKIKDQPHLSGSVDVQGVFLLLSQLLSQTSCVSSGLKF